MTEFGEFDNFTSTDAAEATNTCILIQTSVVDTQEGYSRRQVSGRKILGVKYEQDDR